MHRTTFRIKGLPFAEALAEARSKAAGQKAGRLCHSHCDKFLEYRFTFQRKQRASERIG